MRVLRNIIIIVERSLINADILKTLYYKLVRNLEFINIRLVIYYNYKRSKGLAFRERDPIYLIRRNLKTKRPSTKLDYIKLSPFKITKVIGKTTYKLKLPTLIRIYSMFYILLLELAL